MRAPLSDIELRIAWWRLRMIGDYDTAMRIRAVRLAVESAALAMKDREPARLHPDRHGTAYRANEDN
jgi:hypothetical protein